MNSRKATLHNDFVPFFSFSDKPLHKFGLGGNRLAEPVFVVETWGCEFFFPMARSTLKVMSASDYFGSPTMGWYCALCDGGDDVSNAAHAAMFLCPSGAHGHFLPRPKVKHTPTDLMIVRLNAMQIRVSNLSMDCCEWFSLWSYFLQPVFHLGKTVVGDRPDVSELQ